MNGDVVLFRGAIIRGDSSVRKIALVFTGDEFADGGKFIQKTLRNKHIKASFFLTGRFYRNKKFSSIIQALKQNGNYLGSHSNGHLLYCDWGKRDSLLVTEDSFQKDLKANYKELHRLGVSPSSVLYFLPPYEWYNDSIALWTKEMGLQLVNYTPGTLSHADYTVPAENNYRSSEVIYNSIVNYEHQHPSGLNGFILLMHIGTDAGRTDKFYYQLPRLIEYLKMRNYKMVTIKDLLHR